MRALLAGLALLLAGCINPSSTNCDLGMWLGGAAGTDRCPAEWTGYREDPRYSLGIPFEMRGPSGATHIIGGSTYRAEQAIRPMMDAIERRQKEIRHQQKKDARRIWE